jgi:hypothetical protein
VLRWELLDSTPVPLTDHPRRDDRLVARIHIRPLIKDEETLLTVRCGATEAVASVEVRPEREYPEPEPPEELEFERAQYKLAHQRRRSLCLRAPVEVINEAGTTVARIVSSDQGVVVLGGTVDLEFDEEEMCFVGRVQVDPRVLGARATLTATLGTANARCEVIVAQTEGGGPRLQIEIVNQAQGLCRAYVERKNDVTTIKIFGGHSAIKRYLGPGPDFPNQESLQARLVIAEIIAGEAARLVMQKKYRDPSDLDGTAFYVEHLFYMEKYLERCHRMMLADHEQP